MQLLKCLAAKEESIARKQATQQQQQHLEYVQNA